MGAGCDSTLVRSSTPIQISDFSEINIGAEPRLVNRWIHQSSVLSLCCSEQFIFVGTQNGDILVWDLKTYEKIKVLSGHTGAVYCLALSHDNSLLFSGSSESIIEVWDIKTLSILYTAYSLYDIGDIFTVAYSNKYKTLYFGTQSASIQWFTLNNQETNQISSCLLEILEKDKTIDYNSTTTTTTTTSPPPASAPALSSSSNLKTDEKSNSNDHSNKPDLSSLPSKRFSKFFDSRRKFSKPYFTDESVDLSSLSSAEKIRSLPSTPTLTSASSVKDKNLNNKQFSNISKNSNSNNNENGNDTDNDKSQSYGDLIQIPNVNVIQYAHFGYVYCLSVISHYSVVEGNEVLISGGGDGSVNVWNISSNNSNSSTLEHLCKLECHTDNAVVCMQTEQQFLYAGLSDGEIKIWDLSTMQLIRSIQAYSNDVLSLSVRADYIIGGSACGILKLWNQYFENRTKWKAHQGRILALSSIVRDGKVLLVSGSNDNTVAIWDIAKYTTMLPFSSPLSTNKINSKPASSSLSVESLSEEISLEIKTQINNKLENFNQNFTNMNEIQMFSNDELIEALSRLVSYKSVSSLPELYLEDSRRSALFLKRLLKKFGAAETSLIPTEKGNPIVYGRFKRKTKQMKGLNSKSDSKDTPTILFYGHYDVVIASELSKWINNDPFSLTCINGYLYGRGVTDNKGPVLSAIFAAGQLFQSCSLPADVVFLIEGEEECGSRGLKEALGQLSGDKAPGLNSRIDLKYCDDFKKEKETAIQDSYEPLISRVDYILVANSYWLNDSVPCLTYGLRGVIHATITVSCDRPDLHSGVDGGLWREPSIDLIKLLASLKSNEDETIPIPKFYDSVRPISAKERKLYENIANRIRMSNMEEENLNEKPSESNAEFIKKLMDKWRTPSLTIHNIEVSGPGTASVIPHSCSASISIRIVPDQEVDTIKNLLINYLKKQFSILNSSNKLNIEITHEGEPWLGDYNNKAYKTLESLLREIWKTEPLYIREGGTIPAIRLLEKTFNAPAIQIPCGQSSDQAHLYDERLRVLNLYNSKCIFEGMFSRLFEENF